MDFFLFFCFYLSLYLTEHHEGEFSCFLLIDLWGVVVHIWLVDLHPHALQDHHHGGLVDGAAILVKTVITLLQRVYLQMWYYENMYLFFLCLNVKTRLLRAKCSMLWCTTAVWILRLNLINDPLSLTSPSCSLDNLEPDQRMKVTLLSFHTHTAVLVLSPSVNQTSESYFLVIILRSQKCPREHV